MATVKDEGEGQDAPAVAGSHPDDGSGITTGDLVALSGADLAPELVGSLREYVGAWGRKVRNGDSGALPIVAGLVLIVIIFQVMNSKFLSAGNIVNLLVYASTFVLLGLGETFALLLSEIDLSVGFVGAVGAMIVAELTASPYLWPWWAAVVVGLAVTAAIGLIQGLIITRLRIPSFVVTLAGLFGFEGVLIWLADVDKGAVGGVVALTSTNVIDELVNANISPTVSWIVLVVGLAVFAAFILLKDGRRRRSGLSAPPLGITLLIIAVVTIAGVLLVWVCDLNRGSALIPLRGVPWVFPYVIVIVIAGSALLGRTRFGRYVYAIGSNPEAARRAGIKVALVRTTAFMLCSFIACLGMIAYSSRLGSMGIDVTGGELVLYAVAAAVIAGTSLFGGRGKAVNALLGGVVIAAVYVGLDLLGVSAAGEFMAVAVVLVAALTVDSTLRRRASSGGA